MPVTLNGTITSSGFASGDRIVVGAWSEGPLGPMNDVMWATPDGTRVLIAPTERISEFVSSIYEFDEVLIADVDVVLTSESIRVTAGPVQFDAQFGRAIPIPFLKLRPPFVTRYIEGPIARRLMDVHTHGVTKSGVEEWYRTTQIRWIRSANASIDGVDLGTMANITPLRVGVSEPPRRPSSVKVQPMLRFPGR